ncbi:PH domain-containing protein [Microbacterium aquimaris]|uniref:PH domain-containing protein n=1 Tax=Microbacterium aquimaris TaxID=459816 RepID=UPI002AD52E93|nr:PH domain-containing protein [Microbacterium aquimaris]MDZ8276543.1 PH domain-containing protein [Microbacterium aquimaris]
MTEIPPAPPAPDGPGPTGGVARSPLSDGDWHRMHPLTPLFRGGLVLVIVSGIIIANLRDRVIDVLFDGFFPGGFTGAEDPIDFVLGHDLVLVVLLGVLGVLLIVVGLFYLMWRFHTFRITGDDVEVRSGVLFRTHRRAPLDRVQGVNLTRPMIARLVGMAKLEVVGAGLDANVKLEYLSTTSAEAVRADILRLASGRQLAEATAKAERDRVSGRRAVGDLAATAASTVSSGLDGLVHGAEDPADEPESVVHIPPGRLIASQVLSGSSIALLAGIIAIVAGAVYGTPWVLFGIFPVVLGFGAYTIRTITRSLRYSIAPTRSGVRITFGLFTTVTEIIPPGRVHAVEVSQSIFWRPLGWWSVSVNRLSGRGAGDTGSDQFATVLPVGDRDDVARVLGLVLPHLGPEQWRAIFEDGVLGPRDDDPYDTTPRRARLFRPLSWKRNGFLLGDDTLFLRRGVIWRTLGVFPLARLQSVDVAQGPIDRRLAVANVRAHTIAGRVSGSLGIIDRDAALGLFESVAAGAVRAAAEDHSHRWDGDTFDASVDDPAPVLSASREHERGQGER